MPVNIAWMLGNFAAGQTSHYRIPCPRSHIVPAGQTALAGPAQPVQYPIEHHPVVLSRLPPCFGFSGGNRPFTFFDCSSVISCRFILLFYHCFSLGATICLKTRPREQKLSQSTVRRAVHDLRKAELLETEQRYRARGGKSSLLFLPEEDVTEMHLPSRSLCALAVADVRNLLM